VLPSTRAEVWPPTTANLHAPIVVPYPKLPHSAASSRTASAASSDQSTSSHARARIVVAPPAREVPSSGTFRLNPTTFLLLRGLPVDVSRRTHAVGANPATEGENAAAAPAQVEGAPSHDGATADESAGVKSAKRMVRFANASPKEVCASPAPRCRWGAVTVAFPPEQEHVQDEEVEEGKSRAPMARHRECHPLRLIAHDCNDDDEDDDEADDEDDDGENEFVLDAPPHAKLASRSAAPCEEGRVGSTAEVDAMADAMATVFQQMESGAMADAAGCPRDSPLRLASPHEAGGGEEDACDTRDGGDAQSGEADGEDECTTPRSTLDLYLPDPQRLGEISVRSLKTYQRIRLQRTCKRVSLLKKLEDAWIEIIPESPCASRFSSVNSSSTKTSFGSTKTSSFKAARDAARLVVFGPEALLEHSP